MHHQLLGHLLGALDDGEQESLDSRLEYDGACREEFLRWRRRLSRLEALRPEYEPPPGLAERTCRYVAAHGAPPAAPLCGLCERMSPESAPPVSATSAGWFDLTAIAVLMVVFVAAVASAVEGRRLRVQTAASRDAMQSFDLARANAGQPLDRSPERLALVEASPPHRNAAGRIWEKVVRLTPASSLRQWGFFSVAGDSCEDVDAQRTASRMKALARIETYDSTDDWPGAWRTGTTADGRFPRSASGMAIQADAPSVDPPGQILAGAAVPSRGGLFDAGRAPLLPAESSVLPAQEDFAPRVITAPIVFVNGR